jgi:hypothetical protein
MPHAHATCPKSTRPRMIQALDAWALAFTNPCSPVPCHNDRNRSIQTRPCSTNPGIKKRSSKFFFPRTFKFTRTNFVRISHFTGHCNCNEQNIKVKLGELQVQVYYTNFYRAIFVAANMTNKKLHNEEVTCHMRTSSTKKERRMVHVSTKK